MLEEREQSSMRSLERSLGILAILEESRVSLGLTDIAKASQLSKATASRILSVLERYGYVEKRWGRYRLGAAILPLAHAFVLGNELARVAQPVLQELARITEETASLSVRVGFKRVLVARVEGARPLNFVLPIGERLPLHVGAGKILAGSMSNEELERMLDELGEMHLADGTPLTREQFWEELAKVKRQGYTISLGERMLGIVALGAPVLDIDGSILAAVTLAGARERMTPEKIELACVSVRDAARIIGERYRGVKNP
jgi:IclR family acetate operon transcriptional repressor